ncbi:MAG: nucleoside hydrolase [Clostridia bacterium]
MLKQAPYSIHSSKQIRLIIDTDAGCEADDQFAIAQALMTPKFDVRGICAEHFTERFDANSGQLSYVEIENVVTHMVLSGSVPICHGSARMTTEGGFETSEASELIVREALRDDPRPLYIVLLGAVTNVAAAFLTNPDVQDRVLLVGGMYPNNSWNFNTCNDHFAYNVLLNSRAEWWTLDLSMGVGMQASLMQLYRDVYPCSAIGKYLYERTLYAVSTLTDRIAEDRTAKRMGFEVSDAAFAAFMPTGENWAFWDCAVVGLAMYDHMESYSIKPAPLLLDETGRTQFRTEHPHLLRCYHAVDSAMLMNDFYAKLNYYFGAKQ